MKYLPIYKVEIADGLETTLAAKAAVAWCSPIVPEEKFDIPEQVLAKARQHIQFSSAENKDQMDLYYFRSILVSTGWNLNEDVFDIKETWAARSTPEDKPFNYEHDCTDVIGHHTGNYVIDDSGEMNFVPANTPVDGLPNKFHIVTRTVMYKMFDNQERQERADKIIAEIPQGIWFVSMEAWFNDFDYAFLDERTGESKIVARNEKTAFLTKHLRCYGGNGVYQNYRVGRLLRNITFGGSGLVKNPANPNSIIFKDNASTKSFPVKSNLVYEILSENTKGSKLMSQEINLDSLLAKLAEKDTTIAALQKQVEDHSVKTTAAKVDELTSQLTVANKSVTELTEKVKELSAKVETVTAEKVALKAQFDELTTKHNDVVSAFDAVKAENRKNQRVTLVVDAYGVDKAKAETIVNSLSVLSDEAFAAHVEAHKDLVKAAKVETKTEEKVEKVLETVEASEDNFDGIVADVNTDDSVFAEISEFMYGKDEK